MGLTILEALHDKTLQGKHKRNETLRLVYNLVRKHMAEIDEARSRGYSWKQINDACREAWEESEKLPENLIWWKSKMMIADCYRAVKKSTTVGRNKPAKKEKPLSLKVTVEKR